MRLLALSTTVLTFVLALALSASSCKSSSSTPASDLGASDPRLRCLAVTDSGVTYGCLMGGMGPGDRDDGGGNPIAGAPDGSADWMNLPLYAPCLNNGQCASSICYWFKVKGQFCTMLCNVDSDCPAPSPGCSGQGVCRVN